MTPADSPYPDSRPGNYEPHRWKYSRINGFWAHCSCGFRASSAFDSLLRRKMDRHVREATETDLLVAQTIALINEARRG